MATLTARLDQWLENDIRSFSSALGEGPSATLRRVVAEWWSLEHFPLLEFRDGVTGRRAGLRGGPDVWEIMLVAEGYAGDREAKLDALEEHFGGFISRDALAQAFAYTDRFPNEITSRLNANARVERLLHSSRPT